MSGGHFNDNGYVYYQVNQFADELEREIENNNTPDEYGYAQQFNAEVTQYLKSQLLHLRKLANVMRHIDYLYSGDHGEDSFLRNVRLLDGYSEVIDHE